MSFIPVSNVKYADSANIDSFGRLRTSETHIVFSSQFARGEDNFFWQTSGSGTEFTASFDADRSSYMLQPGTGSGDIVVRQSKEHFTYRVGQSHKFSLSYADFTAVTNVSKRMGYFDVNDGIFLESSGSDVAVVLRNSIGGTIQEEKVLQADWNIDTFSGSGVSGITLDLAKTNNFIIDFQWSGAGRARLGFNMSGSIHYVHEFRNTARDNIFIKTPNLPLRYEIQNLAAVGSTAELEQICASIEREGGVETQGIGGSVGTFNNGLTATTTARSVFSLRLRQDRNRIALIMKQMSILNNGSDTIRFRLVLAASFTSGALTWSDSAESTLLQTSVTQLDYVTGSGAILTGGYVASTNQVKEVSLIGIDNSVKIVSNIDGVSDIITIIVESDSGTPGCDVSLIFQALI